MKLIGKHTTDTGHECYVWVNEPTDLPEIPINIPSIKVKIKSSYSQARVAYLVNRAIERNNRFKESLI